MIAITNTSGRVRYWRVPGGHVEIAAEETAIIEGELPGLVERRKWARAGLDIRAAAPRSPTHAAGSFPDPVTPPIPSTAYLPTSEPQRQQAAVKIPADWRDMAWPVLRALAAKVTDVPVKSKAQAIEAIEAELDRRG